MFRMRTAEAEDHDELRELFDGANDAPYPLAPVFTEKLRAGHDGEAHTTVVTLDGRIVAGMIACGSYLRILAVGREHRRRGLGAQLLRRAEEHAAANGSARLVAAAEPGNYFTPGIHDADTGTIGFLERRGYSRTAEAVNLNADLDGATFIEASLSPHVVAASPEDRNEVIQWIAAEFGRIWAFEVSRCFEHALPSLYLHREGGEIRGFSAHAANNGALGTYGPAGVARQWRRHGIGRGLLLASLADLRERGFGNVIIQWAAALEFYEKTCGARLGDRFIVLEKDLTDIPE